MNDENNTADRTCRTFVLIIFGAVILAFLLAVSMFRHHGLRGQRPSSTHAPALRR